MMNAAHRPSGAEPTPIHLVVDHERNLSDIRIQAQADLVFDLMRGGASSPNLLHQSILGLQPCDLPVYCRALQKRIEQAKK